VPERQYCGDSGPRTSFPGCVDYRGLSDLHARHIGNGIVGTGCAMEGNSQIPRAGFGTDGLKCWKTQRRRKNID